MKKVKFNENSTLTGIGLLHGFHSRGNEIVALVEIVEISRVRGPLTGNDLQIKYRKGQIIICSISSIDVV
jgi:hypothetical protein